MSKGVQNGCIGPRNRVQSGRIRHFDRRRARMRTSSVAGVGGGRKSAMDRPQVCLFGTRSTMQCSTIDCG